MKYINLLRLIWVESNPVSFRKPLIKHVNFLSDISHMFQSVKLKPLIFVLILFALFFQSASAEQYTCSNPNNQGELMVPPYSDSEDSTGGGGYSRYFLFVAPADGELSLNIDIEQNTRQRIYIGTSSCNSSEILDTGNTYNDYTNTFHLNSGEKYLIRIRERNGANRLRFSISADFTPDVVLPSIDTCPGIVIPNLEGAASTVTDSFNNQNIGPYQSHFYHFTPAVDGEFRIDFDSDNGNRVVTVRMYDTCGNVLIDDVGTGDRQLVRNVPANHLIIAEVYRRYNGYMNYGIDFTFTVLNAPPVFTSTPVTNTVEGLPYVYTATATDADSTDNPVSITLTSPATLPGWLTWNDATDTLSGTPGSLDTADVSVTLTASDGKEPVNQTFTIEINNKPLAKDGSAETKMDTPVDVDLSSLVSDDGAVVPPVVVTGFLPSGSIVSANSYSVTFTPALGFLGTAEFKYKVIDDTGLESYEGTITIQVNPNNDPIAYDKTFTTSQGSPINGNAITGVNADTPFTPDSDPDGDTLTVTSVSNPLNGNLVHTPDGNFTYTPDAGFIGSDLVSYTISDGAGGTATASILFIVTEANADLSIVKSAPSSVVLSAPFSYILTVSSSAGTQYTEALNVKVQDVLPEGVTFRGVSSGNFSCSYAALTGTLECDKASMQPGDTETITINVTAPSIESNITNTALTLSTTPDSNQINNESTVTTSVVGTEIDLAVYKSDSADPVVTSSAFDYTISVENLGGTDATEVRVIDSLPSGVNFVSATRDANWDCAQPSGGSTVVPCDYVANGGVLAAGATTPPITIRVTAPGVPGTLTNRASVNSAEEDDIQANNTDEETTEIIEGTVEGTDYPLTKYLQYNVFGDMKLIGNANVNFSGSDPNQGYNDNVNMRYVDTDANGGTFNSSSSTLVLSDPGYEIIWAGLYWGGSACSYSSDGNGNGNITGCNWSNSNYSSYNNARPHFKEVLLKTPNSGGYTTITANKLNVINYGSVAGIHKSYVAFADITHLLGANETGTYTVANIVLSEGQISGGGNFGGWALLVIYKDPNNQLRYKNVSVFNGFQAIRSDNNPIDIQGFVTPLSGPVTASIAFYAFDGDPVSGGVARMRIGKSNSYSAVGGDTLNPTSNLFNSTVAEFGQPINSGITKTYGIDADRVDVSSFMTNDQGDTRFYFDVSTPSGGVDHYFLTMFAFATDLVTPIINDFNKTAIVTHADGTTEDAGPGVELKSEDHLVYRLAFENTGDEIALDVEIFDDFDEDNLTLIFEVNRFDAFTIRLSYVNSTTWDPSADCGYDAAEHKVWCKLDRVDIGDEYIMEFEVDIKQNLEFDQNVSVTNTAYSKYKNATTGSHVILTSNGYGGKSNTFDAGTIAGSKGVYYLSGPFAALDIFRWDLANHRLQDTIGRDKNISTKKVNEPFTLGIVSLDEFGIASEEKETITTQFALYSGNTLLPSTVGSYDTGTDDGDFGATFTLAQAYSNLHVRIFYCGEYDVVTKLTTLYPIASCPVPLSAAVREGTSGTHLFYHESDHFAVKPNGFAITVPNTPIKAGKDFDVSFEAFDVNGAGNPVDDFNQTVGTSFTVTLSEQRSGAGCTLGTFNPDMNASWGFSDGNVTVTSQYSEVGSVAISIDDTTLPCASRYASVDCGDKDVSYPSGSWNSATDTVIGSANANMRFIPDHFKVNTTLTNHNTDHNFTYISADLNMSAKLDIEITAEDENNNTTANYTDTCYAEQTSFDVNVTYSLPTLPNALNTIHYSFSAENTGLEINGDSTAMNNLEDGNDLDNINKSIFPTGANNGVANVSILFNFNRNNDDPIIPYDVNITGVGVEDSNGTKGSDSPDRNATFYYGCAKPARSRYEDITADSVDTPVTVVIYCNAWPTCTKMANNIQSSGLTDDPDWWLSLDHDITKNDGNVTLQLGTVVPGGGGASVTTAGLNILQGVDTNITVTCGTTRPVDIGINLNLVPGTNTSSWLVCNLDNAILPKIPFYSVECIGQMGWAGHGGTGYVVDTNASRKRNRKLGW